jgi:hypothetical protein
LTRTWAPAVALGAVAALTSADARAEPVLAARTGLGCASCHLNRTGGGGRTAYGAGYGAQTLPWKKLAPGHGLFDGAIGDRVRLGLDARGGYLATFRDAGPYIGEAVFSEGDLYLAVDLLKDRLSVYIDEHVAPGGASAREAFALYAFSRAGLYVKGGKFFVPFGLRLQDDEAASRRMTGFTFDTADIGAEVGLDDGKWATALAITNGTSGGAEGDNGKQYSWTGARLFSLGRIGLSGSFNDLPAGARRAVAGAFGTFSVGPMVVLAEADVIRDDDGTNPERRGGAGHLEVDMLGHAGLTLRVFGGAGDLDRDDGIPRLTQWGLGVDWTPLPGLQIRGIYRSRNGPSTVPSARDDQALVEAHVYF